MLYKASAPGSLMLLGEYAVLHRKQALVCAVNKRITVKLEPRHDDRINIASDTLGNLTTTLQQLKIIPPFQFVLAALIKFQKHLTVGCDIHIESEFSHQFGLGSSSAVTVALIAALSDWLNLQFSHEELIKEARAVVRQVQGLGSGADVAASVLGGIVHYKAQPLIANKIPCHHPLTVIYSGYKTPTVEAVAVVKKNFLQQPKLFKQIFNTIDCCVRDGLEYLNHQDWLSFGKVMNVQQGLMDSLGVNNFLLSTLIDKLRANSSILGAKISGSGMGDCVIGLGSASNLTFAADSNIKMLPLAISSTGVVSEKV